MFGPMTDNKNHDVVHFLALGFSIAAFVIALVALTTGGGNSAPRWQFGWQQPIAQQFQQSSGGTVYPYAQGGSSKSSAGGGVFGHGPVVLHQGAGTTVFHSQGDGGVGIAAPGVQTTSAQQP